MTIRKVYTWISKLKFNIILSRAEVKHAEAIVAGIKDQKIDDLAFFVRPTTISDEREYIQKKIEAPGEELFIIRKKSGDQELIGTCGLHNIEKDNLHGRLGLMIFPQFRDSEYEYEVIAALLNMAYNEYTKVRFHKLYRTILDTKSNEILFYRNLGFHASEPTREHYLIGNKFYGLVEVSITRPEWEEIRNGG